MPTSPTLYTARDRPPTETVEAYTVTPTMQVGSESGLPSIFAPDVGTAVLHIRRLQRVFVPTPAVAEQALIELGVPPVDAHWRSHPPTTGSPVPTHAQEAPVDLSGIAASASAGALFASGRRAFSHPMGGRYDRSRSPEPTEANAATTTSWMRSPAPSPAGSPRWWTPEPCRPPNPQ